MAKCRFCSAEIPADSIFCTECGGKDPIAVTSAATATTSEKAPAKSKKGLVIGIIAGILALILVIGGVLFFVFKDDIFGKENDSSVSENADDEEKTSDKNENKDKDDNNEDKNNEYVTDEAITIVTDSDVKDEEESSSATDNENSDLAYIKSNGKIVIGITDFAPMDYQDENGNWIGFDAELATAFAKRIGVEVEFVEIDWSNKASDLRNKNIDLVWNGMTLTDEVKSTMDCSDAYCNNAQVVIIKASEANKYQTAEDCKNLKFAVEKGSAGEMIAEENGFTFTSVITPQEALSEIESGTCDAAIIDAIIAAKLIRENPEFSDLTYIIKLNSEEYGVGCRKGSNLVDELNLFFMDSYADGSMQKIAEKYGIQAALVTQW